VSVSASLVSFPITVYTAKAVISRSQFKRHPNLSMTVNMPLVCRSLCNIYATCNEAFHLRLGRFHALLEGAQLLEDHVTSALHCANFAYNWLRTSRSILRNYIQWSFKLNAWRARETEYVCFRICFCLHCRIAFYHTDIQSSESFQNETHAIQFPDYSKCTTAL